MGRRKRQLSHRDSRDVWTIADVADYLLMARITVYRHAEQGILPGRKVGHQWRFYRDAVLTWTMSPLIPHEVRAALLHARRTQAILEDVGLMVQEVE